MMRPKAVKRTLVAGAILSAIGLSAGSALAAPPAGPSFDQVLAAPDDVKSNIDYARAQADAGNLLEAAAALERVLLTQPDQADARLFYVVVLYRLDDQQDASDQLRLVDTRALSPVQQAEAAKYRRLIDQHGASPGQRSVRVGGSIAAGVAYDSDAGGALQAQFDILGAPPKQQGWAYVASAELHAVIPVGKGDDTALYASAGGYDRWRLSGADNELESLEARLGLARTGGDSAWSVGAVARTYTVLKEHYLDEFGAQAQMSWRRSPATVVTLTAEAVKQDFHEPFVDQLVIAGFIDGTRDGGRYDVNLAVNHRFSGRSSATLAVGDEYKTADYKPFGYNAPYIRARWDYLMDRGVYLNASGELRKIDYREIDPFFTGTKRKDTRANARLALGAPLSAFSAEGATGDRRENLAIEAAVSYTSRDSEFPIADYNDWGAELRLIWRFGSRD
jgi:hypothetical protein